MRHLLSVMIIWLIMASTYSLPVLSQPEVFQYTPFDIKYIEKTFTVAEGMPQNTATSMIQSRDGYIWLTTFGGLARYDGFKFKVFTTGNTPELTNNRLTSLYEDKEGTIWIGSEDGDVIRYRNGVFDTIFKSPGPPEKAVTRMMKDNNGRLWVGSGNGLKWIDVHTAKVKRFYQSGNESGSVSDVPIEVTALAVITNKIYVGTMSGLFVSDLSNADTILRVEAFAKETIELIAPTPEGKLLVRTENFDASYQDEKLSLVPEDKADPDRQLLNAGDL
ncbi:MAG: hypothetical protein KF685_08895 [Acidobacteria bacterium]|nr:hypothetical protein [Acidobacteriota bacterium]